jgi:hypothetical protein
MTTVKAFLEMYTQFIEELSSTFPDEVAVKNVKESTRDRKTFEDFMKDVGPWTSQMMAKNDSFFCEENNFVSKLNLQNIWKSEDATENTKAAIWQYLQTMYILGNTINMFPPETLSMIESAAEACAKNMQANGKTPADLNEKDLMAGMNNMIAQMMGGGGGLEALMGGGLAAPPATPKPKSKSKNRRT